MLTTKTGNVSAPLLMNVDDRMGSCALPVLLMVATRIREWCGPVLLVFHDQTRECAGPRPVGTRGGCGAGWGPGACPPRSSMRWGSVRQDGRTRTRTSTRPPHPLHPTPCPYRTRDAHFPIRLSNIIRTPWAASTLMDRIPRFGRQNSLVTRLLRIGLRHAQLSPKSLAIG